MKVLLVVVLGFLAVPCQAWLPLLAHPASRCNNNDPKSGAVQTTPTALPTPIPTPVVYLNDPCDYLNLNWSITDSNIQLSSQADFPANGQRFLQLQTLTGLTGYAFLKVTGVASDRLRVTYSQWYGTPDYVSILLIRNKTVIGSHKILAVATPAQDSRGYYRIAIEVFPGTPDTYSVKDVNAGTFIVPSATSSMATVSNAPDNSFYFACLFNTTGNWNSRLDDIKVEVMP